jgi:hypothetical protein
MIEKAMFAYRIKPAFLKLNAGWFNNKIFIS